MWREAALLLLVVLLVAANAVFVAAEFSFVTVDRPTVDRAADAGDRRAGRLRNGLRSLSTQMSGAQLGITVTSLVVGFIAEPAVAQLLVGPLAAFGLPEASALPIALVLALLLTTAFQAVFGELVPKNWAISQPLRVGRAVAGLQLGFTRITGPLLAVLHGSANKVLRLMGIEPREELTSARTPQELVSLVSRSRQFGVLDDTTATLVTRSILFGDRTVADVMTPRPKVHFLPATGNYTDVIELVRRTGHARFPVVQDSPDDLVRDILDEQDHTGGPEYQRTGDEAWLLSGLLRPDEASDRLGIDLPEGQHTETLGGLIIESLGRLPREGDSVVLTCPSRADGTAENVELALTVSTLDSHRVDVVRARVVTTSGEL